MTPSSSSVTLERSTPNLDDPKRHHITRDHARSLVEGYRSGRKHLGALRAGAFGRAILDDILGQNGCHGLRIYLARTEAGSPTFVLVGVDDQRQDLKDGIFGDDAWPCPPFCPGDGAVPSQTGSATASGKDDSTDAPRHLISAQTARILIENYRNGPRHMGGFRAGAFDRPILERILAQDGCEGIRIYLARKETGAPTLVAVGIDNLGVDMAAGIYADDVFPCPPFCGGDGVFEFATEAPNTSAD